MLRALLLVLSVFTLGCGTVRAVKAVQDGRIDLKVPESQVVQAAGKPDLILARRGVETFYYQRSKVLAVSVSLLKGVVVAFDDSDKWPLEAAKASEEADDAVAKGAVRVGMTEAQLESALGDPDGITAKDSQESLHWLTGDEVDSVVQLKAGKLEGYWDRPVSEYTQNLPTSDRDNATTGGKIRVGMTMAQVEKILGKADSKKGGKGVKTHRYESDPVFGDTIWYSVVYKDDTVVDLYEFNVTRDEDKKEEEEAARLAAEADKRGEEAESSIFSFLDNPLVKTALNVAGAAIGQQIKGGGGNVSKEVVESTVEDTLEIDVNGNKMKGTPCNNTDRACPSGQACVYPTAGSPIGVCQ